MVLEKFDRVLLIWWCFLPRCIECRAV